MQAGNRGGHGRGRGRGRSGNQGRGGGEGRGNSQANIVRENGKEGLTTSTPLTQPETLLLKER
jgi:hypothetical protein